MVLYAAVWKTMTLDPFSIKRFSADLFWREGVNPAIRTPKIKAIET